MYYIEIVLYKTILLEKPPRYLRRKSWNLFGGIPGQKLSTFRNNLLRKSFRKISKGTPWVHGLVTSREIHGKNDKALQKLSEEFWNFRLKVQEEFMKHFLKKKNPGKNFCRNYIKKNWSIFAEHPWRISVRISGGRCPKNPWRS